MDLEEVGFIVNKRGGEARGHLSLAKFSALLDKAAIQTQNGVCIWVDMQVVVGKH